MRNVRVSYQMARILLQHRRAERPTKGMDTPRQMPAEEPILLDTGAKLVRHQAGQSSRYYCLGYHHNGQDLVDLGLEV